MATPRQLQLLCFIAAHIDAVGYPPTYREMMAQFGWRSTNAAGDHLRRLEQQGLVESDDLHSRGLRVTELGRAAIGLRTTPGECFTLTRCLRCDATFVMGRGQCQCPKAERSAA